MSLVPEGYIPLPHQIGGHRHVDGKLGEENGEERERGWLEGGGKTLVLYLINKQRLAAVATDLMPLVAEYPCYSYLRM